MVMHSSRNRREQYVQMPAKIARSAARPPFGLPEMLVAVHTSRLSCRKLRKPQYSRRFRSHLENPS